MANAWCINAISYEWCFIQTLQNLDSACIWVWVQFTAPDPLDDKRFDYIKYTDKCGCTCCLTNENEILIYATQWTLKNLTLTNDDANEVVNVKRTDVFWSNRKKTVVRYKTGSAPVSITDWTLAVEELVQNQYSSSWFNVEWLEDWTTYYFSAFAVAQDDTIIVVQTKNITTDFYRKPWTDTLAYWKLDWNLNDSSWNSRNLTNAWQLTFATVDWIQCASCNWDVYWNWYAYCQSLPTPTIITVNMRAKATNNRSWTYARWLFHTHFNYSWWNDWVRREMYSWNGIPWVNVWNWTNFNYANYDWVPYSELTSRNLRTTVRNNSTHQIKIYRNSVLYKTQTFSSYIPSWSRNSYFTVWIWYKSSDNINRRRLWRISETIVEQKERTQEELTKYFNKLKSKYWIS